MGVHVDPSSDAQQGRSPEELPPGSDHAVPEGGAGLTWDLGATVNPEEALAARMRLRLPPGRSGATPQNEALPGA